MKPRLRGVSHQFAFIVALIGGGILVSATPAGVARGSVAVFAASLAWLLGASALYHRPMWPQHIRARLKRLDPSPVCLSL